MNSAYDDGTRHRPRRRVRRFLTQSEHVPLPINNHPSDLAAFATWLQSRNSELRPVRSPHELDDPVV
jgi:hypothetical protein